jgi:hypothetical protein
MRVTVTGLRKMPGWTFNATVRPPAPGEPVEVVGVEAVGPESDSLRPENLRRIPWGEVLRLAEGTFRSPILALVAEHLGVEMGSRPYGGSIDHHRAVATLYRTALSQDIPPREAIAEMYGVTTKTVSRWVAEARATTDPATGGPVLGTYQDERNEHGFNPPKAPGSPRAGVE